MPKTASMRFLVAIDPRHLALAAAEELGARGAVDRAALGPRPKRSLNLPASWHWRAQMITPTDHSSGTMRRPASSPIWSPVTRWSPENRARGMLGEDVLGRLGGLCGVAHLERTPSKLAALADHSGAQPPFHFTRVFHPIGRHHAAPLRRASTLLQRAIDLVRGGRFSLAEDRSARTGFGRPRGQFVRAGSAAFRGVSLHATGRLRALPKQQDLLHDQPPATS